MSQSQVTSSGSAFSLTDDLSNRILLEGPITFHEWMSEALYHESAGYYVRPGPAIWGRAGDYRTSPETSELFAATFARFFVDLYEQLGRPKHFPILECGAGDGSFAEGVLQSLSSLFPEIYSATSYAIAEISNHRVHEIERRLERFSGKVEFVDPGRLCEVDCGIVFSNELLDAFPVHLITKQEGELVERYVGLDGSGRFAWVNGPLSTTALREMYESNGIEILEDQIIELSPAIDEWLKLIASTLRRGYLIAVDYGAEAKDLYDNPNRFHGTLRAYARHRFVDVLTEPGNHDITAHVNWTRVRAVSAALGLKTIRFEQLDKFLVNTGLLHELDHRLAKAQDEGDKVRLTTASREMILPTGMASSFQVLIQYHAR